MSTQAELGSDYGQILIIQHAAWLRRKRCEVSVCLAGRHGAMSFDAVQAAERVYTYNQLYVGRVTDKLRGLLHPNDPSYWHLSRGATGRRQYADGMVNQHVDAAWRVLFHQSHHKGLERSNTLMPLIWRQTPMLR